MSIKPHSPMSQEEIRNLITSCNNQLKPIVIMALSTGMRISDILALRWDYVDLNNGLINLPSMRRYRHEIPLTKTTVRLLKGLTKNKDTPYVFCNPKTGKPFHDIRRPFMSACEKAMINDLKFHDLRRTFLNNLYLAGDCSSRGFEIFGFRIHSPFVRICDLSPDYKVKLMAMLDKLVNGEATTCELQHSLVLRES